MYGAGIFPNCSIKASMESEEEIMQNLEPFQKIFDY